ncbi:MAG: transcriptional regulator [Thermoguttaceae bacterium]|nr:transcriptional regulator [Thermoguttaceae bacterium]MDW8036473.1 transcriptional regulator [Thermoguttaceae bacterium]
MNEPLRSPQSEIEPLPGEILELANAIDQLPMPYRTQLAPLMCRVMDSTRRRRRILNMVQEALAQLRLDMKYLIFDLEATRRERDAYRQQLDQQNNYFEGEDGPPLEP